MTSWSILAAAGREKTLLPRLDRLHEALAAAQLPHLHPVAHQRAESFAPELAAGAAPEHLASGVDVIEAAEGLFNAPPAQKTISCEGDDAAELSLMQVT